MRNVSWIYVIFPQMIKTSRKWYLWASSQFRLPDYRIHVHKNSTYFSHRYKWLSLMAYVEIPYNISNNVNIIDICILININRACITLVDILVWNTTIYTNAFNRGFIQSITWSCRKIKKLFKPFSTRFEISNTTFGIVIISPLKSIPGIPRGW